MEILSLALEEDSLTPHGITNCVSAWSRLSYMLCVHRLIQVWTSSGAAESYICAALRPFLCAATDITVENILRTSFRLYTFCPSLQGTVLLLASSQFKSCLQYYG